MPNRRQIILRRYKARLAAGEVILCALCGQQIPANVKSPNNLDNGDKGGITLDHIVEKSRGGSYRVENLQPTHLRCNWEKSLDPAIVARLYASGAWKR